MKKGYLQQLEAGLLNDGESVGVEVIDGESILEEIAAGNEDIIPDGYTEIDGEMTVVENLADAVEEEELIMEEVELLMVEAGSENDFNANTLKLLAASNRRLNVMMGVDEKRGAPVASLESDVYGGYKKAFVAGLEAKEGFLKNLKANVAKGAKAILDTIKKWIQKAIIFFNGAASSAKKIDAILKKKSTKAPEGKDLKTTEDDKKAIAKKFAAWLVVGGKLENYDNYANMLKTPVVPKAGDKLDMRTISGITIPADLSKSLKIEKQDSYSLLSLTGATVKTVVLKPAKDAAGASPLSNVFPETNGKYSDIEVTSASVSVDDAAKKVGDTIPTIVQLTTLTGSTAKLAEALKTSANENYTAAESYPKAIKELKEGETSKGAALEKVSRVATRVALENIGAYMSAMKSMLWLASTYAKRYEDSK